MNEPANWPKHPPTRTPAHAPACRQPAGAFFPLIDRNRCEGAGPCVAACPTQVLQIGVLTPPQRRGLSLKGRIKAFAHRHRQAQLVAPGRCEACGACVQVCPEQAITLRRGAPAASGVRS